MAVQESQGLKIALIVFALLWVVSTVMWGLNYKWFDEERVKGDAANKAASEAKQKESDAERRMGVIKGYIGFPAEDKDDVIKTSYEADMERFSSNFAKVQLVQDQQNYRHLVEFLYGEVRNLKTQLDAGSNREVQLKAALAAAELLNKSKNDEYLAKVTATGKDLASEQANFKKARDEFVQKLDDTNTKASASRKTLDETIKADKAEITRVNTEYREIKSKLTEVNALHASQDKTAQLGDGKVTWVNQKSRVVWLNVGSADGLRRQVTFNVIGSEETNPGEAKAKGKIEVTRLIDDHLAEARILEDSVHNPILPADVIYSVAWQPGERESFAVAGFVDIDGDNHSDHGRLLDLIKNHGGVVDADITEEGERIGRLTARTRFLVLGDPPSNVRDTPGLKVDLDKWQKEYAKILGEAEELGIRRMSIKEFLDHIGYRGDARAKALGKAASAKDFKPELENGVQRRPASDQFRRRVPEPLLDNNRTEF